MALRKLTKRLGIAHFDLICVAGGARCLSGDDSEANRQFVLEQIRASIRLHDTHTVLLMLHSDCGAYGGLPAFKNDAAREVEHHRQALRRARDFLSANIPELNVMGYFVDFEGVWEALNSQAKELTA
jgi:hypothetical protein